MMFPEMTFYHFAETVGYASNSLETILLHLSKLHSLYNSCLINHATNPNSNEYKLIAIVLDIACHRPFKPVSIKKDEIVK
jgi:hypothetical protein